MSNNYLISISIGPVQEFIASARKLRDLWFGSNLLSELSKTVARSLQEQKAELIFPAISNPNELERNSELNVANKILAVYNGSNPKELILTAKTAWKVMIRNIGDETIAEINKRFKKININEDMFRQQIEDIGEFYAAYVAYEDSNYAEGRKQVEQLLSGRKNLRSFKAPTWDGSGYFKNSLDGIREAVTDKKTPEIIGLLKKNERLDAIGLIKRFNDLNSHKFNDLSGIALIPFKKAIKIKNLTDYENEFNKITNSTNQSTELWYNDDMSLKNEFGKEAVAARRAITKEIGQPPLYASILVGDGDKIGELLNLITTKKGHQLFSKHLSNFASSMQSLITEYQGELIYSGGDDVMAYLPIHTMLQGADAIRKAFAETMKKVFNDNELQAILNGKKLPTFSIGLAVIHHSYPLDRALNIARKAETTAKEKGDRNALTLILSKRGGADLTITEKWDGKELEGNMNLVEKIENLCQMYDDQDSNLSATLGYQLREIAQSSGDELSFSKKDDKLKPANATSAMVMRTFMQKSKGKEADEKLMKLLSGRKSLRKLSDELVIAKNIVPVAKLIKEQN